MTVEKKNHKKRRSSYSIFLIPQDHSRIQKIHISARQVSLLIGTGVVALLFLGFNIAGFWYYRSINSSLLAQQDDFEQYQKEKTEFAQKVALLEETVSQTEKYAAQLGDMVGAVTPPERSSTRIVGFIEDPLSQEIHTSGSYSAQPVPRRL